jgi:two-component system nitrogen regulation response regulator GlnG
VINCVAIPETLLESELFGYEKGAFTGAVSRRVGKIQQAHRGTVFLDEIGDMPLSLQAKILRLLQEKSIERLGGRETIPVDVRIIAATNRDLEVALAEGRFREDLYYRLKVVTLWLPPLRDRMEDIPLLVDYLLKQFCKEMATDNPGVTEEAHAFLSRHSWPGNVRELANALQKALIFSRGGPISLEGISQAVGGKRVFVDTDKTLEETIRQWVRETLATDMAKDKFNTLVDRFSSILLAEALDLTSGNRTRASELLGMSRPTLLSKIEKYGLKTKVSVKSD